VKELLRQVRQLVIGDSPRLSKLVCMAWRKAQNITTGSPESPTRQSLLLTEGVSS